MIPISDQKFLLLEARIFRFYGGISAEAELTAGMELFCVEMKGDETFPAGLIGSLGYCDVVAANAVTLSLQVNGVEIGTGQVAAGATEILWIMPDTYNAAKGDAFGLYAPTPPDASLAGIHYVLAGTRR